MKCPTPKPEIADLEHALAFAQEDGAGEIQAVDKVHQRSAHRIAAVLGARHVLWSQGLSLYQACHRGGLPLELNHAAPSLPASCEHLL